MYESKITSIEFMYVSNALCVSKLDGNMTANGKVNMSTGLVTKMVAQKLIRNALRIDECTFHIRSYLMVANVKDPLLVFYCGSVILRSLNPSEIRSNRHQSNSVAANEQEMDKWGTPWRLNMQQFSYYFAEILTFNVREVVN
eukprot:UN07582